LITYPLLTNNRQPSTSPGNFAILKKLAYALLIVAIFSRIVLPVVEPIHTNVGFLLYISANKDTTGM